MATVKAINDPYSDALRKAGERITARRIEKKLSKRRLAKLAGVDVKVLRAVELPDAAKRNNCSPELSVRTAIRLSIPLDTTPQWLLFGIGQV